MLSVHLDKKYESLNGYELSLLKVLICFQNPNTGQCNPSSLSLQRKFGHSRAQMYRTRARLLEGGLIQITRREGRNHYQINIDPISALHVPTRAETRVVGYEALREKTKSFSTGERKKPDLAKKIDNLLSSDSWSIFFDENGRVKAKFLASTILTREGKPAVEPPPGLISAVRKCANHWRASQRTDVRAVQLGE